jgi:hypothetical protein
MTLAAVAIDPEAAAQLISRFKADNGIQGEVKGSRINLSERAGFFKLLAETDAQAEVGIALSATRPAIGADRGTHDLRVYAGLLERTIDPLLLVSGGCANVIIDDGRYAPLTLGRIRNDIAAMLGTCGRAELVQSHHLAGLQIADVIANSFFSRALPSDRQMPIAAQLAPMVEVGRIRMKLLSPADLEPRRVNLLPSDPHLPSGQAVLPHDAQSAGFQPFVARH